MSFIVGLIILIVIPLIIAIFAFLIKNYRFFAILSIVIGMFICGIPLGILSIIFTRKWYNTIKEKKKKTKSGYTIMLILGIATILAGIINIILIIIFL